MTARHQKQGTTAAGSGSPPLTTRRRRRWILKAVLSTLIAVALIVSAGFLLTERFAGDVERLPDPFAAIPESIRPDRPAEATGRAAVTFLVAGVDTRSEDPTTGTAATSGSHGLADAVLLIRLSGDRRHVSVVSIPRDAWVPVPDQGLAKINAAYAYGGPPLLVTTVERLTDVRVDHVAVIDFAGFRALTDAVGGVTVTIGEQTYDPHRDRVWPAGTHHLDGNAALDYVRQRAGLPRGDLDRAQRHQAYLRALIKQVIDTRTLANPVRFARVLDAISQNVSVDENLSDGDMRDLLLSLRGLDPDQVFFATAPVGGLGSVGRQAVVHLDATRGRPFWAAFENGGLPAHVLRVGTDTLSSVEK